jgi:predicted phosphate transport protein (TIGR00153 family)
VFGARPPHPELFDLLAEAGANVQRTAELVYGMLASWPEGPDVRAEITSCEHEGDRLTHKVIERLREIRMAPIDRHDIYALTGAIDDVVDDLEEVSEEFAVYRIEAPMEQAQQLAGIARDSSRALRRALDGFRTLEAVDQELEEIRRLEHEGDRVFRDALAGLFAVSVDPLLVIRWKDVYQGLEDAIDRSRQASDVLRRIIVKHG